MFRSFTKLLQKCQDQVNKRCRQVYESQDFYSMMLHRNNLVKGC